MTSRFILIRSFNLISLLLIIDLIGDETQRPKGYKTIGYKDKEENEALPVYVYSRIVYSLNIRGANAPKYAPIWLASTINKTCTPYIFISIQKLRNSKPRKRTAILCIIKHPFQQVYKNLYRKIEEYRTTNSKLYICSQHGDSEKKYFKTQRRTKVTRNKRQNVLLVWNNLLSLIKSH